MKKLILLILLIPSLLFAGPLQQAHKKVIAGQTVAAGGVSYIHDILLDDNAASTDVLNDGSAAEWTADSNTSTYHSTDHPTGLTASFDLAADYRRLSSPATWAAEKFKVTFWINHVAGSTSVTEEIWQIGDGDTASEANEVRVYRNSSALKVRCMGDTGSSVFVASTNYSPSDDTWYLITIAIDASSSPWTLSGTFQEDGGSETALTWDDSTPNAEAASWSTSQHWLGSNSGNDPNAKIAGFKAEVVE